MPPLTALLADPSRKVVRYHAPLLGAVLLHQRDDLLVLFLRPRPLDQVRVENLLPPVKALHVAAVGEVLGDLLPVLSLALLYGPPQNLVLLARPPALAALPLRRPRLANHRRQRHRGLGELPSVFVATTRRPRSDLHHGRRGGLRGYLLRHGAARRPNQVLLDLGLHRGTLRLACHLLFVVFQRACQWCPSLRFRSQVRHDEELRLRVRFGSPRETGPLGLNPQFRLLPQKSRRLGLPPQQRSRSLRCSRSTDSENETTASRRLNKQTNQKKKKTEEEQPLALQRTVPPNGVGSRRTSRLGRCARVPPGPLAPALATLAVLCGAPQHDSKLGFFFFFEFILGLGSPSRVLGKVRETRELKFHIGNSRAPNRRSPTKIFDLI